MNKEEIKRIGELAATVTNSPESALVLIRELCKAILEDASEKELRDAYETGFQDGREAGRK